MGWIRRISMAALMVFMFCSTVAAQLQIGITGPDRAIVGEVLPLEVTIPAEGYSKVECTLSLDDSQVQIQSLPEAQGWDIDFKGMTWVMTRREGGPREIRLSMKLKVLPVQAQTNIGVSFRFAGEGDVALGEVTHEITVAQPLSHENFLTELSVEGGTLSPQFHPDVLQYSATVPAHCQQPQLHAVGADKSKVEVSRTEFSKEGTCVVTVTVTAENGSEHTYTIQVTREKPEETIPETTASTQPATQATEQTQPIANAPADSRKDGVPGWLVAAAVLAGAAVGGAGGILLSQKKGKDR